MIEMIDDLFLGNEEFRKSDFNNNIELYRRLTTGQSPKVLWIGCSDSRVSPERITGSKPGDLFIHRNIGNVVPVHDWNFATVLEYAVAHLKVTDIVINGHSDCGAIKALDIESNDHYIPLWLSNAREAKERVDSRMPNPESAKVRSREIELENIRLQIEHLVTYPVVKDALKKKRVEIHGLYYDLATGVLSKEV